MNNLAGSDWHKVIQPVVFKTFAGQNLAYNRGNGVMSLLKVSDSSAATVRTATKMAATFNGSTQYASKSSPSNVTFAVESFSIIAWINPAAAITSPAQKLFGRASGYSLYLETSGRLYASYWDGTTTVSVSTPAPLTNGQWYLIIATYDRSGNLTLYVDGVSVGTPVSISALGAPNVGANHLAVGATSGGGNYFNGSVGECQIVSGKVLSLEEVGYVYSYGIPDSWGGGTVVAHYKWNSNGTDESASANTLTLTASPTIAASTYTQYATYNNDGSIRLWGVYLATGLPTDFTNTYSVLCYAKPLWNYDTSVNHVLINILGSTYNFIRYLTSSDKIEFGPGTTAGAGTIVSSAYTTNAQLNTLAMFLASTDYTNNIFELFINGSKIAGVYTSLTAVTITGFYIGYPNTGVIAPIDIYKFALFNKPIAIHQAINISNAYEYAY